MELAEHDKPRNGFDVSPEQLAHDLELIRLSKSTEITEKSTDSQYYEAYVKARQNFVAEIKTKTRFDSAFNK